MQLALWDLVKLNTLLDYFVDMKRFCNYINCTAVFICYLVFDNVLPFMEYLANDISEKNRKKSYC